MPPLDWSDLEIHEHAVRLAQRWRVLPECREAFASIVEGYRGNRERAKVQLLTGMILLALGRQHEPWAGRLGRGEGSQTVHGVPARDFTPEQFARWLDQTALDLADEGLRPDLPEQGAPQLLSYDTREGDRVEEGAGYTDGDIQDGDDEGGESRTALLERLDDEHEAIIAALPPKQARAWHLAREYMDTSGKTHGAAAHVAKKMGISSQAAQKLLTKASERVVHILRDRAA
jgi:hypothetical protein